jgi:hypothetical protein
MKYAPFTVEWAEAVVDARWGTWVRGMLAVAVVIKVPAVS